MSELSMSIDILFVCVQEMSDSRQYQYLYHGWLVRFPKGRGGGGGVGGLMIREF